MSQHLLILAFLELGYRVGLQFLCCDTVLTIKQSDTFDFLCYRLYVHVADIHIA